LTQQTIRYYGGHIFIAGGEVGKPAWTIVVHNTKSTSGCRTSIIVISEFLESQLVVGGFRTEFYAGVIHAIPSSSAW